MANGDRGFESGQFAELPFMPSRPADAVLPRGKPRLPLQRKRRANPCRRRTGWWLLPNPLAAEAAAAALRNGGSAIDAAIAAQAMLGLVEPQSSGLGGGAFLVYRDGKTGEMTTLDGREIAPAAATPQLFQNENGEPLKFFEAVIGGRSVGVPGTPALMAEMHRRWGKLPWPSLLEPAIRKARFGFEVSPRLAGLVQFGALFPGPSPTDAGLFPARWQAVAGWRPAAQSSLCQDAAGACRLMVLWPSIAERLPRISSIQCAALRQIPA